MSLARIYNHLAAMGVPRLRLYLDPAFVKDDEVVKVQAGPMIGSAGVLLTALWGRRLFVALVDRRAIDGRLAVPA